MANRFRKTIDLSSLDAKIIYSLKNKENLSEYIRQLIILEHSNDSPEKSSDSNISREEIQKMIENYAKNKKTIDTSTSTNTNTNTDIDIDTSIIEENEHEKNDQQKNIEIAGKDNLEVNSVYIQEF